MTEIKKPMSTAQALGGLAIIAAVLLGLASIICALVGIWSGDDRWISTAWLLFSGAFFSIVGAAAALGVASEQGR